MMANVRYVASGVGLQADWFLFHRVYKRFKAFKTNLNKYHVLVLRYVVSLQFVMSSHLMLNGQKYR
jgi:hypothetical protein